MANYEYQKPEDYKKIFIDSNGQINQKKLESAYTFAVKNRELEIQLFWQRSALFWGFVAASFTGYFALIVIQKTDPKLITLIAILGWVVSIIWYLVCRGSKYWQENWEMHIDLLEDEISGPIYRIISNPKQCSIFKIVTAYSVSVSKLNILLALFISLIWSYLLVTSLFQIKEITNTLTNEWIIGISCCAMFFAYLIILLLTKTSTKIDKLKTKLIIRQ